jgi:hypothetical protein
MATVERRLPRGAAVARGLLWIAAAALLILGVVAFVAPDWASANFPWKAGPFFAMTVGGWAIGTGLIAADAARDVAAARVYTFAVYLVLFAAGQLVVVVAFRDKFLPDHVLAWPYLVGLVSGLLGALCCAVAWRPEGRDGVLGPRSAPDPSAAAPSAMAPSATAPSPVPGWGKGVVLAFTVFVGLLALGTFIAGPNGTVAQGNVFPEALTLFSIRAFCAFLFALTGATATLLAARQPLPFLELGRAGLYLIVPTTLAALLHIDRIDPAKPGTLFYLVTYVAVGVLLATLIWTQRERAALAVGAAAR